MTIMAADCPCKRCDVRRSQYRTPYHLKKYDDTTTPPTAAKQKLAVAWKGSEADCSCAECTERLESGKRPIHLKKYDDTTAQTTYDPIAALCDGLDEASSRIVVFVLAFVLARNVLSRNLNFDMFMHAHNLTIDQVEEDEDEGQDQVNYWKCTPQELKNFIVARKLKDPYPAGLTMPSYYVPILIAADENPTFRFLDLPSELQNVVYRELLILQPLKDGSDRRYCSPQILATCKQINDDARGIIYADNTLICDFIGAPPDYRPQILLHNDTFDTAWEYDGYKDFSYPSGIIKLCDQPSNSIFHKIHSLEINIDIDRPEHNHDGMIQNSLLIFVSSLMEQHNLQTLTINFHTQYNNESYTSYAMAEACLYPLRRLRNIPTINITGAVPKELATSIKKDMRSPLPAFNTWKHYRAIEATCRPTLDFMSTSFWRALVKLFHGQGYRPMQDMWPSIRILEQFNVSPDELLFASEEREVEVREIVEGFLREEMWGMEDLVELKGILEGDEEDEVKRGLILDLETEVERKKEFE